MSGAPAESPRLSIAVLVSGNGSNLQAILDAIASGSLSADVRLVVSNRAGVRALERARSAGVPTVCIPHADYPSRAAFDERLRAVVEEAGVQWVVLAGFMRILGAEFLGRFRHRVVNIHPALLPAFPGMNAQRQAFEYGVRFTGCTVHLVDEGVDTGPVIDQSVVQIEPDDTLAALEERIHSAEHELLVSVLRSIADGRVRIAPAEKGARARVHVARA